MAGDWIKMRIDLATDPAVVLIATRTGLSEDETVGKLHRLWGWASRQTRDGSATVTAAWIDKYVARDGFAVAMSEANWLTFTDNGVLFPGFDRHNSLSAKARAENTRRQNLSRTKRDKSATREEKRREEIKCPTDTYVASTTEMAAVADSWNMLGVPFPKCAKVSTKRRTALKSRLADPWWRANWRAGIERVRGSPFCRGETGGTWVATFEWFIKPDSLTKILEGTYDLRGTGGSEAGGSRRASPAETRERGNVEAVAGFLRRAQLREGDAGVDGPEANGGLHRAAIDSVARRIERLQADDHQPGGADDLRQ